MRRRYLDVTFPPQPVQTSQASIAEVQAAVREWVSIADDADQLGLALALSSDLPPDERDEESVVAQARLLLLARRTDAALSLLSGRGYTALPADAKPSWPLLVLAACLAAKGDIVAYRWLLGASATATGPADLWRLAYLIAAAASAIGDQATADQAWSELVLRHRIVTGLTFSRFAAAHVAQRDADHAEQATLSVVGAARDFDVVQPPIEEAAQPVLDAVGELQNRGDAPGARLLLHALSRTRAVPRIDAALESVTPARAMRRYTVMTVIAACLAVFLLPLGGVGILVGAAARRLWTSRVRIPGLGRTYSVVWRAINTLRFDPVTESVDGLGDSAKAIYALVGIVTFFVGFALGFPLSELLAAATGAPSVDEANPLLISSTWFSAAIGFPVLSILLVRRAHRRHLVRGNQSRRASQARRRLAEAKQCQCWSTRYLAGEFASVYLERHLLPVGASAGLAEASTYLGNSLRLGRCTTTGCLWLGGHVDVGGGMVLLRAAAATDAASDGPDAPSAGFYL